MEVNGQRAGGPHVSFSWATWLAAARRANVSHYDDCILVGISEVSEVCRYELRCETRKPESTDNYVGYVVRCKTTEA